MTQKRTLISLFAGAGGLDLGLEQAGFITKVANELESHACETLRKNKELCNLNNVKLNAFLDKALQQRCFKSLSEIEKELFFKRIKKPSKRKYLQEAEVIEGDIRKIPSEVFLKCLHGEQPYCIAGGPPCQPFSKAGKQKSLDCSKNGDLFFEFVRLVGELKPKWFIFENVKGITFTKTDVIYQKCITCGVKKLVPFEVRQNLGGGAKKLTCLSCGNNSTELIINNEAGGSLKIIFNEFEKLGYKCSYKVLNAADYGAPQIRERLLIVGSLERKVFHWPLPTHKKLNPIRSQGDLFENGDNIQPWVTMYETLWPGTHPIYGEFNKGKAKLWVKNVVRPHDEPVTWSFNRPSPTIGAHQGAKLAFAPNGVPEKQLFRQQWSTKGRRQGDTPPVDVEHQYLSDEELLKLQTFPESWYLHGTRMQRAFQIGNAVPPALGRAIGKAIIKSDKEESNDD